MDKKTIAALAVLVILAGLAWGGYALGQRQNKSSAPAGHSFIVGNDRDSHGCIGSAGYSWCGPKQKCLRPWEEACK